jgi:hypothetical protein
VFFTIGSIEIAKRKRTSTLIVSIALNVNDKWSGAAIVFMQKFVSPNR